MSIDYITHKETEYIFPIKFEKKEEYFMDLLNIEHSWTGRIDVMFSNTFFNESIQLIINAIVLFEKGYFDCAFYSLRQSLEISTTSVYFVDDSEENRENELKKWKAQERFPMQAEMIKELQKRENVFADIKNKMKLYFEEIEKIKQKLNKYVHKQGFNKFYVSRNHPINKSKSQNSQERLISDFETCLIKCVGAVAVYRLAIDPFPVLLNDDEIYNRTEDLMTNEYSNDFIEKYIGMEHIEAYKQTDLYKSHYDDIITIEAKLPPVVNVVKHSYIDRLKIQEILSQKHLLSTTALVAVILTSLSEKIAKVHCVGGWHSYFTNNETIRTKMAWSSTDFDIFKDGNVKYNANYDEAFLSHIKIWEEDYYIEHNEEFDESEIKDLEKLNIYHNE